ncbi:MAG: zinc-binding alcohol dehydrogenase [Methylacidiphilales bacterium]|nr:zinc-binding alcohol dehydrogenase [Candidatus Methylacidiphilales bacterium]
MPKRLVCSKHDTISWEEYELPAKLEKGRIRVRNTHGAEKHGTKIAFIHGHGNKRGVWDNKKQMFVPGGVTWNYPIPLGNNQVGIVEQVGPEVDGFKPGDRILYYDGFSPVADVSQNSAWKLDASTSWKAACCLDPAKFALGALRDGNVRVGDAVAVFSLGAIGLMAVQLAKASGCYPIIAIDPLPLRREAALKTGADEAIDPIGTDVGARLREATGYRGVDVVIEYSGAMEALQASLRGVAFGGNVVLGGFPGPMKAGLDLGAEAHMNRPNLIFSRMESDPNRDHPRWNGDRVQDAALHFIRAGLINAEPVITPVLKFSDKLISEYDQISNNPEKNIKLGVEY